MVTELRPFIRAELLNTVAVFSLEGRRGNTEARKPAAVIMLIPFGAFDIHSTRLNDPANVVTFGEKLASCEYG